MVRGEVASTQVEGVLVSSTLKRLLSGFSDHGVAILNGPGGTAKLCTFASPELVLRPDVEATVSDTSSRSINKVDVRRLEWCDETMAPVDLRRVPQAPNHRWRGFSCMMQGGLEDRVALELEPSIDIRLVQSFLEHIWPILREDCLRELTEAAPVGQTEDQLLWMALDRMDVALVILNGRGLMYRVNAAGRQMLEEEAVLKRARGGIFAAVASETQRFHSALADCAANSVETTIFIANAIDGRTVPVTVAPYRHDGEKTNYVVVTVPRPPDRERIEQLALSHGLTPAEARVARYLQIGLSNKDAARLAGISEQTFSTYAKRVFSKLDAGGRAEVAQLLTWQAAGGRVS